MKQTFIEQILGPGDIGTFLAAIFYAMVGVVILLLLSSAKRDQTKVSTPDNFSWGYLIIDNLKRLLLGFLLILVSLRFSREIFGAELTMYFAFGIGLISDMLGKWILKIRSSFSKDE